MKTRNILLSIGVAALTAITISAVAGDIALSPRAAANQIKTVPGITVAQAAPATGIALSPRAAANQTARSPAVANDVNPALQCRKHDGQPEGHRRRVRRSSTMPGCRAGATTCAAR